MDNRLTVSELAKRWRCTTGKLYLWRNRKIGVKSYKDGGVVYYELFDVKQYERHNWSVKGVKFT